MIPSPVQSIACYNKVTIPDYILVEMSFNEQYHAIERVVIDAAGLQDCIFYKNYRCNIIRDSSSIALENKTILAGLCIVAGFLRKRLFNIMETDFRGGHWRQIELHLFGWPKYERRLPPPAPAPYHIDDWGDEYTEKEWTKVCLDRASLHPYSVNDWGEDYTEKEGEWAL